MLKIQVMKKIIVLIAVFMLTFMAGAFAYTDIKAQTDKLSLTTDDTLNYKITITSTDQNVPGPALPKFEGFNVLSKGQTSTISFAKNQVKTVSVYAFVLEPKGVGTFKIEPAQIKIEGDVYATKDFQIEVTQGKLKPKTLPQENQPESGKPQVLL